MVSDFEDAGLIQLIVDLGAGAVDKPPRASRRTPRPSPETITNNTRKLIIDEHALNPKYYDKMSALLDAILGERRKGALDYKAYLAKLLELAAKVGKKESDTQYPDWADNGARRALVDFFHPAVDVALVVDTAVRLSKPDSWVGNHMKEKRVRLALAKALPPDFDKLDDLFKLVKARSEYR